MEVGELPVSPQALNSPAPISEPSRQVLQENPADVSDDDQMVICEEGGGVEIDLKCKEKVTDSDSESQSDVETSLENRSFPQQRFSPVSSKNSTDVTYRPKPIKAIIPTSDSTTKYSATSSSNTLSYYSPVNPSGITGFQPTGGAFKTMPVSPKVGKNEVKTDQNEIGEWSNFSDSCNNIVTVKSNDAVSQWVSSSGIQTTTISSKSNHTLTILKPQAKESSIIQMGDNHNQTNQFPNQPVTVAIFTGQPALCLSNDTERSQPVVVVASTPSEHPVQYVYMPPPFTVSDSSGRNLSLPVQLVPKTAAQSVIVSQPLNKPLSQGIPLQSDVQTSQTQISTSSSNSGRYTGCSEIVFLVLELFNMLQRFIFIRCMFICKLHSVNEFSIFQNSAVLERRSCYHYIT